ncbi:MAG: prepilin-type N-terminal cleavage/methylation domain-containing protein [Syntrophaceae bacterium]|nr:prepilin-type N-terminal cleavage/methylation domain-containing protein [Syntrophaceae bacterium]
MNHDRRREKGFTLVETIISLVIIAVVATMLFTYSASKANTGSPTAIQWSQSANNIHAIMERITADYQGYPRWKPNTAYILGSRVTPIRRDGYFYQPKTACTSGTAEPSTWDHTTPISESSDVGTGCTWRPTAGTPANPNPIMPLVELRERIAGGMANVSGEGQTVYYNNDPSTGMQYTILNNRYIDPNVSWDTASATATGFLKVTIQTSGNERLTSIFTGEL